MRTKSKTLWAWLSACAVLVALCPAGSWAGEAGVGEWQRTLDVARKEGQVILYGSNDFETLFAEFHKKYPDIKVTGFFGRGADVAKRVMAERRANKYLADL
jgi:ABC-type glycerol-3-phosphate transport system substrate-binding protein